MKFPDEGFRLLCLFRYWNIINYYFPYKHLLDKSWDDVLKEFIPKLIQAKNEINYKVTLLELVTQINDFNGGLLSDSTLNSFYGKNIAPFEVSFIEEKPVVISCLDYRLDGETSLLPGDIIEKINGISVDSLVGQRIKITPASKKQTKLRNIASKLLRTNDSTIQINLKRNGVDQIRLIKAFNIKDININAYLKKDTCFRQLTPKISYLFIGTLRNEHLRNLNKHILNSKGLIIDLRCYYPSDNTLQSLVELLYPTPKMFLKATIPSQQSPGRFDLIDHAMFGKFNADYYKGEIVILVNEKTQSVAETYAMAFQQAPRAKVVGSETAGENGNWSRIFLPGGVITFISSVGIYYPDGREVQRVGIVPDIFAKPTIQGIVNNQDEVLQKALDVTLMSIKNH